MRVIAAWILALGLIASPAMAGAGGAGDGKDAAKGGDTAAAKDTSANASAASSSTDPTAKPAPANLANEIQQLKDLIEAQSRQLQAANDQLKQQQKKMQEMEHELKTVNAAVVSGGLLNEGADPALTLNPASGSALNYSRGDKEGEPTAIHFKGITLTPGGFFVAETVWRNRGITNDVNTDFKGIPQPGQSAAQLSEFNFSGRQSRISMKAEGKLDNLKLTGYYEGDFLSAGTTSNNNHTNSYTFRQRQFWGQAAWDSGWKITGGQMWSLVTETKHGLDNLTEALPATIDAQYHVGFTWAREYGVRVTKNFGDKFWVGLSAEGPQTTLGGKIQNDTTLIAAPGDGGGLFNNQANYSYNETPDFVVKAAWEPGFGHYEIFGIVSTFKARIFPCANANVLNPCSVNATTVASAAGASNDTVTGGGVGANGRWSLFDKHLDLGFHIFVDDGEGRLGSGELSDVTVHPNGTLEPIRNYQSLGTIEVHPTPKLDIYAYGGGEYDARTSYTTMRETAAGPPATFTTLGVGYGSLLNSNAGCFNETIPGSQNAPGALGSCQQDNRNILEGTLGFWYRFYAGSKGRMQFGMQYSYAMRNTWSSTALPVFGGVTHGGDPHGNESMFFTSMRYYLP
jgi:hypothetical protein